MKYSNFYKLKEPEGPDYYDVEDFNFNTEIIDKTLNELAHKSGSASEQTVTVPYSAWQRVDGLLTQTVTVEGVTPTSIVLMGIPMNIEGTEMAAIIGARINAIAQGDNSITLRVYQADPGRDISLSFVIM